MLFNIHTGRSISSLSDADHTTLKQQLQASLRDILDCFACYTFRIQRCLEKKEVVVRTLWSFLSVVPCSVDGKLMLLSAKREKFERADYIANIFITLKEECSSFLDYHIFELISTEFEVGEGLRGLNYPEKVQCYINKHKISEFIDHPVLNKFADGSKKLVLVLDIDAICRVCKIVDLGQAVAKIMKLEPHSLLIHEIREACVIITFLIPAQVADAIFVKHAADVFSLEKEEKFRDLSVTFLECNGYEFDFTPDVPDNEDADEYWEAEKEEEEKKTLMIRSGTMHAL